MGHYNETLYMSLHAGLMRQPEAFDDDSGSVCLNQPLYGLIQSWNVRNEVFFFSTMFSLGLTQLETTYIVMIVWVDEHSQSPMKTTVSN